MNLLGRQLCHEQFSSVQEAARGFLLRASQLVNLQMRIVVRWVSSHRAIAERVLVRELLGERQGSVGRITGPLLL